MHDMTLATAPTKTASAASLKPSGVIATSLKPPLRMLPACSSAVAMKKSSQSVLAAANPLGIPVPLSRAVTLSGVKRKLQSSLSAAAMAHNAQIESWLEASCKPYSEAAYRNGLETFHSQTYDHARSTLNVTGWGYIRNERSR
jgi:hypothetical protein